MTLILTKRPDIIEVIFSRTIDIDIDWPTDGIDINGAISGRESIISEESSIDIRI